MSHEISSFKPMPGFDPVLYQKYNIAGPRYTSYPTVPYWDRNPSETEWLEAIDRELIRAQSQNAGAAIYIHIPFCESLCTYCGCNKRITRNHEVSKPYLDLVLKEFDLYRERLGLGQNFPLSDLHLGGGTPTFLTSSELSYLLDALFARVQTSADHEFAVEVDPRVTSREQLQVMHNFGFKRISMGIQDFDPIVQDIVNRVQSAEEVQRLTEDARSVGYTSVNFDLIYGLPKQNLGSITDTIEKVVRIKPDRIAFYSYAHVPWIKPSQRRFTEADLPEGKEKRELYETGRKLLEAAGYIEIGMDHFALAHDDLYVAVNQKRLHRNFMGYLSKHVSPLLGLGVSSIGDAWSAFAQNDKQLEVYRDLVLENKIPIARGHVLNDKDLYLRHHIISLMTQFETNWNEQEIPKELRSIFADVRSRLAEMQKDNLVVVEENRIQVSERGRPFVRNICMALDERLLKKAPDSQLFSKTV